MSWFLVVFVQPKAFFISSKAALGLHNGCTLSPTLFEIYIGVLESFLYEHIQGKDDCLLHHVLISLLLVVDDLIFMASSPKGL